MAPIYQFSFYLAISITLIMGTESVLETLWDLHTLTRLSARDFVEFCHRESFKTFLKFVLLRNLFPVQIKQNVVRNVITNKTPSYVLGKFLGAFPKLRESNIRFLNLSFRPSVRTHGTTRLPLGGFSRNFIFVYFS
jgi:hypothetical protein